MKGIQECMQSVCFLCEQCTLSKLSLSVTFFNPQLPLMPYYFTLQKRIQSLLRIQEELERCIYDWGSYFTDFHSLRKNAKAVEMSCSVVQEVNRWIIQVRKRRDVLTFSPFVDWFDISQRYKRWRGGKNVVGYSQVNVKSVGNQFNVKSVGNQFNVELPLISETLLKSSQIEQIDERDEREQVQFEEMFPFDLFQRRYFKLLPINKVKCAIRCTVFDRDVLLILEEYSIITRVKSLLRSLINRPKPSGAFTVCSIPTGMSNESNTVDQITIIFRDELDVSPRSVHYCDQERVVVIRTDVGLYLYRCSPTTFSLVSFVEMRGCLGVSLRGNVVYCLLEGGSVCSYCIGNQEKILHRLRLESPRCILYTREYDRLLISGSEFVYVVRIQNDELVTVRKINTYAFDEMSILKEYVLGVNYQGCVNVIEMRNNDSIIGVVTSLNVPPSRCGVHVCAQKRNVLLTEYNGCITLIDTIEGPFGCKSIKDNARIVSLWWEGSHVVAVLEDGVIVCYRVWL